MNNWFFGNFAGLDFSAGDPVPTNIGQIAYLSLGFPSPLNFHNEGTSSISDINGGLLYYSNGTTLYNSNHQITPNGSGLEGNVSSTQSSIFVPDPANPSGVFYLFTMGSILCCGQFPNDFGLRYSKIDNCLDNGNGDIISGQKNIPLMNDLTEKMAVVRHANGVDYWLLTHKYNSNEFIAMRITAQGIEDTISSFVGTVHQNVNNLQSVGGVIGQMKISPNGQKVALGSLNGNNILEVFDFNTTTGFVSNPITIFAQGFQNQTYGVEFSPNSNLLYTQTATGTQAGSFIYQFDLSSNNQAAIIASQTALYNYLIYNAKGLQLGPNNRIYIAGTNSTIHVINEPNVLGLGCNFQVDAIQLLSGTQVSYSLPTFIAGFDYSNEVVDCSNDVPDFSLGPDITICPESSVTLNAPPNQLGYLWNTGATSNSISVNQPGTYWVTVTYTNGTASDTIVVSNFVPQNINIIGALELCEGNTTTLTSSNGFTNYQWSTGAQTQSITVGAGTYWLTANDSNGCITSDTVVVSNFVPQNISIIGALDVCEGNTIVLTASSGFTNYQWNIGEQTQSINVGAGTYWITANDSNGCITSDTVVISNFVPQNISIFGALDLCEGNTTTLTASSDFTNYQWNTGEQTQSITVGAGTFWLTANDSNGCISSDTVNLGIISFNGLIIAQNTAGCAPLLTNFLIEFNSNEVLTDVTWSFGDGNTSNSTAPTHSYQNSGVYEVSFQALTAQGCEFVIDTMISIALTPQPIASFELNPSFPEIGATVFNINSSENAESYVWLLNNEFLGSNVNESFSLPDYGSYQIMLVANNQSCADTATILINIQEDLIYYIPNTFTPNGDGINSIFIPVFTSGIDVQNYEFLIYNRWGKVVFNTVEINKGWDGKYLTLDVPDGVYVYQVRFKESDSVKVYEVFGHVNLLR